MPIPPIVGGLLPLTVPPTIVDIPGLGSVQGIVSPRYAPVKSFYAIPYAKPPIGELRWAAPMAPGPFATSPLNGTAPTAVCMQPNQMYGKFDPASKVAKYVKGPNGQSLPISEDCLTLNVAAGATTGAMIEADGASHPQPTPVMVWFHGGGLSIGAGAPYPGDALVHASGGSVVVVTVNYRLNVFGFLGSAELAHRGAPSGGKASTGNYGIQDQRLALFWVREHIGAFGGDPASITIFGESAGGTSGMQHLVQPASWSGRAEGLYHRLVIQSGGVRAETLSEATATYSAVLNGTKCSNVACLLKLDAASVAATWPSGYHGPVIDGVDLMDQPDVLISQHKYNTRVPVIVGGCREEYAVNLMFEWQAGGVPPHKFTEDKYNAWWSSLGLNASMVERGKRLYAQDRYPYPKLRGQVAKGEVATSWWWANAAAGSDLGWERGRCSTRRLARMFDAGGTPAVYTYTFAHPPQRDLNDGTFGWENDWFVGNTLCPHGSDVPSFTFGDSLALLPGEEAELGRTMGTLWTTFAGNGAPSEQAHVWPRHTITNDTFFILDVASSGGTRAEHNDEVEQCQFWDEVLLTWDPSVLLTTRK